MSNIGLIWVDVVGRVCGLTVECPPLAFYARNEEGVESLYTYEA